VKKALAIVWAIIVPLLLSALIHSIDPDIGGIRGLATPSAFFSVVAYGLPALAITLVCLMLAIRFHWALWVSVSVVFSAAVALTLALLQTPRLPGLAGIARPLIGAALLVWLFLAAAILPARALGWPQRGAKRKTTP